MTTAPPRPSTGVPRSSRAAPWRRPVLAASAFAVAVAVLVSGTVFAFVAASGTDGAPDPVAAVQGLLLALEAGDAVAVLDALPPGERAALADSLPPVVDELQRLGLLAGFPLSRIPGITVDVQDVRFHTVQVHDEVARVTLASGRAVVEVGPDQPLPELTRAWLGRDFELEPGRTGRHVIDFAETRPTIVATKEGGGWHTSAAFTLAEAWRGPDPGPLPRFNQGVTPTGAPTPDAAVRDLLHAAAGLDAARVVSLAYRPETRALYDYASLVLPEARRQAQAVQTDDPLTIAIDELEVRSSGDGPTRQVRVERFAGHLRDGEERLELAYRDRCLTVSRPSAEPITTCDGVLGPPPVEGDDDATRIDRLTAWQQLGRAFPTFVVHEQAGRWYVSPIRTVATTAQEILHGLEPDQVDALLTRIGEVAEVYRR